MLRRVTSFIAPLTQSMLPVKLVRRGYLPAVWRPFSSRPATIVTTYQETMKYLHLVRNPANGDILVEEEESILFKALQGVWKPVCITGEFFPFTPLEPKKLLIQRSVKDLTELHRIDVSDNQTTEGIASTLINTFWLDQALMRRLVTSFQVGTIGATVRPLAMMIHAPDSDISIPNQVINYTPSDKHAGRVVAILDSAFSGGEVVVTYDERTETVSDTRSWIAYTNKCSIKLNPVASGTRVLLVYDIFHSSLVPTAECDVVCNTGEEMVSTDRSVGEVNSTVDGSVEAGTDEGEEDGVDKGKCTDDENAEESGEDGESNSEDGEDWYGSDEYDSEEDCLENCINDEHFQYYGFYRSALHDVCLQERVRDEVRRALTMELDNHTDIIIALYTLYPEGHHNPATLRGGDRALYDMLHEHFNVEVVAATVLNHFKELSASLYSRKQVKQALRGEGVRDVDSTTKLVIPNKLRRNHVLDYLACEDVYMVSGLRITRK